MDTFTNPHVNAELPNFFALRTIQMILLMY